MGEIEEMVEEHYGEEMHDMDMEMAEEEEESDGMGMLAKLLWLGVLGGDTYLYLGVGTEWDATKTTMEAAGTWSSSDWGTYETFCLTSIIGNSAGTVLLGLFMPDLFWIWSLIHVPSSAYKWSLLNTAMTGTMGETNSSLEAISQGLLGYAIGASALVTLAAMGSGGDDEEEEEMEEDHGDWEEEHMEEKEVADEEPADEDGGDAYGGYYGYYY